MTLQQVIKTFERVASKQPSVNMIVQNDIFRLNSKSDARYGVFGWTQGQHSTSADSSMFTYSFTFFYVDRLRHDSSNQIEIQSVGIQTLDNILRTLDDLGIYVSSTYTFQTFNQRFFDECAGVFCNVTLQVLVSLMCSEKEWKEVIDDSEDDSGNDDASGVIQSKDFNDDYNNDFLIY